MQSANEHILEDKVIKQSSVTEMFYHLRGNSMEIARPAGAPWIISVAGDGDREETGSRKANAAQDY